MKIPKVKIIQMFKYCPNRMTGTVARLTHCVNKFSLLFLCLNVTYASPVLHPDLKASFNARTYPIGAQIVGNLGVSFPVWGNTQNWKYGYVRGGLNLMTSAVVNRAGVELQFFPISIAGITLGYDTGVRNFVPKWLDCNAEECTGRVDRKQVRLNLVAAHAGFSFMMMTRLEELTGYSDNAKAVFDETSLLIGKKSGESILTFNPVILYKIADQTHVGFTSLYSRALDTGGYSHLYGPVVNLNPVPKWNVLLGAGLNSSPIAHSAICGFMLLQYNIKPSLSVVDLALRNANLSVSESPTQ